MCAFIFSRKDTLALVFAIGVIAFTAVPTRADEPDPVRVLVWDERQEDQKQAYGEKFLGQSIAAALEKEGFLVRSSGLDDAAQGLDPALLDWAEVLIWWGHVRHSKITPETGKKIARADPTGPALSDRIALGALGHPVCRGDERQKPPGSDCPLQGSKVEIGGGSPSHPLLSTEAE